MTETQEAPIKVHLDMDVFSKIVTVDELIGMEEGNIRAIRNVLAKFVLHPKTGKPYPVEYDDKAMAHVAHPAALKLVGGLSIEQLNDVSRQFLNAAEGEAVPPASAPDSTQP